LREFEGDLPNYLKALIKKPGLFLRETHFIPFALQDTLYDPPFNLEQFKEISDLAVDHLSRIPNIVKLNERFEDVLIVGDTHGFINSTIRIIQPFLEGKVKSIIFLGDYVDRGESGLVNFALILALMIAWPENVVLLRGNHEQIIMNKNYGFQTELLSYYDYANYRQIEELIDMIYDHLSIAAITPQGSIALHGGIPQELDNINELEIIPKPHAKIALISDEVERNKAHKYFEQIRWNDPRENQKERFLGSYRGYYFFNETVVNDFLKNSNAKRIIRAHESGRGGYMNLFDGKLIHVFSAEPYGGIISMAFVIHEQLDGKTVLRDLDFNYMQDI
jgi:hypothetical protein